MTVRIETRIWSKGSARGAGPKVGRGTVRVDFDNRAADVPMCQHGIAMRRCDDCGAFVASHPGVLAHRCDVHVASCADERKAGAA